MDVPDVAGVVVFAVVMLGITGFGLGALSWVALGAGLATTGLAVYGPVSYTHLTLPTNSRV